MNQQNEILEQGKWGNVFKFDNGQIKYLMESAHRELKDVDTSVAEITLKNSIAKILITRFNSTNEMEKRIQQAIYATIETVKNKMNKI